MSQKMKHGSLFSGIGGFDLAAEWMGWENVFHCEINKFCQQVLKYYWPNAKSYEDIKLTDFSQWRNKVDVISGGFPCQPYSQAGARRGKEDDRHLWPEMLRAIREVRPRWVVGENVPGLINWSRGMVLKEIKADLEAEGFEIFATVIIPACAKNAPHKRERLWIVANSNGARFQEAGAEQQATRIEQYGKLVSTNPNSKRSQTDNEQCVADWEEPNGCINRNVADSKIAGQQMLQERQGKKQFWRSDSWDFWEQFPTQSPLCSGDDGIPAKLDGITFSKWRTESVKAYGNAIVPQVVYEIFKAIETFESCHKTNK